MLCTSVRPTHPAVHWLYYRIVQLGFLTTAVRFLRQAESVEDQKAEELLSHSLWCLSLHLTEIRSSITAAPPTMAPVGGQCASRTQYQDRQSSVGDGKSSVFDEKCGKSSVKNGKSGGFDERDRKSSVRDGKSGVFDEKDRKSSVRAGKPSVLDEKGSSSVSGKVGSKRYPPRSGDLQETHGLHRQFSKLSKAGQEENSELTRSATSLRHRTLPPSGSSTVVGCADRATGSTAAVPNSGDGSGRVGSAFARSPDGEDGFGAAGEGGTRGELSGIGR